VKIKRIYFCFLFFLLLASISCIKKPQWQTDITIPIISKSYSIISQLDSNLFRINTDSSLEFYISGQLDTVSLIDSIQIPDHSDTLITASSDFIFNGLVISSVKITPDSVIGMPLPESVVHLVIPPFSLNINKNLSFSNISMASVQSCVLGIKIVNGSRLTFDSITCSLPTLEIIRFDHIDSLSITEFQKYLDDVTIESIVSFNIFLVSNGTGSESIPISMHDSLKFIITLDSLQIDSCCFRSVPPRHINLSKRHIYSLTTNYKIQVHKLGFQSGQLSINLDNQFPLPTIVQCSIPELIYDTMLQLPAENSVNFVINLANRNYQNSSESLIPITLQTTIEFTLDSNYICLGPDNLITISYTINNIKLDSITGTILDTIHLRFNSDSINIHFPEILKRIEAINAYAVLTFTNAIAFPINFDLTASAVSNTGSATIDTIFSIAPGTPSTPQISNLSLNFTRLFNLHPEAIVISSNITMIGAGSVNRTSYGTASYILTTPLRIILRADTISFIRSIVRINRSVNEIVRDYADSSIFYAHLQNHFPSLLSGEIILQSPVFDSVRIGFTVLKGVVDNSGMVIIPVDTTIEFSLNNQQTKIFTDSMINVAVNLFMPNTDTIIVTGQDYFRIVNSFAKVRTQPILKKSHSD
jgi:hypothetical protein